MELNLPEMKLQDLMHSAGFRNIKSLVIFKAIEKIGPLNLTEISAISLCSAASTTATIRGAVKRGHLEYTSSGDDRRIRLITLTPKGVEFLAKYREVVKEMAAG